MLERKELLHRSIPFSQALAETALRRGRIYKGPDAIDIGNHAEQLDELIDYTNSHPRRYEAGRVYYVEGNKSISTSEDFLTGTAFQIVFPFNLGVKDEARELPGLTKFSRQKRLIGALAHTHSRDSIYTLMDLQLLLLADYVPSANTSVLLITPKRKILTFRGEKTPQVSPLDLNLPPPAIPDENETGIIADQSYQESIDSYYKDVFRNLVRVFGLQVFEGDVRGKYLQRMTPEQIAR